MPPLLADDSEERSAQWGKLQSLGLKVIHLLLLGICGKADQSLGNLTSVVTTGAQGPAVPGHKS